ncbi:patatin-like phospholipase domain-containing protein 2 [Syngnathoides biaculeatus]|uniref:patatin-like phospholipase domain-containing protein 2 n=1 Tax=Syngnathoides biaculeatus TaxID=300417 RepID=UPI002ADD524D|nr:patatin-like phospholipase domain-containing protein 2 [Syngnathoides biaculeatus]
MQLLVGTAGWFPVTWTTSIQSDDRDVTAICSPLDANAHTNPGNVDIIQGHVLTTIFTHTNTRMSSSKEKEWSLSFAGCGFMGIYYVGASSCILERFPCLIRNASKIYGASAGALMAASLATGVPLEKCCTDLMYMAKEARKHKLGPLHPSYNLLQLVKESLLAGLPPDAHLRASGRLCISLTRVSDCKNVLVSDFDSREDLVQALLCSCFVPFYCGVIPPTYRGVHYVDGAVSDNLPRGHQKSTITVSAYAGESDLCPRGNTPSFHQVRFNNVSIQVNSENVYRVTSTFFPPQPEDMAEICHNGWTDALRFLQDNNLIDCEPPPRSLEALSPKPACCDLVEVPVEAAGSSEEHWWLNPSVIENLPVNLKKVLCVACRQAHPGGGFLSHMSELFPLKVSSSFLRFPSTKSFGPAFSLAQRMAHWLPDLRPDLSWLYRAAGGFQKNLYDKEDNEDEEEDEWVGSRLQRCSSLPSDLNLWSDQDETTLPSILSSNELDAYVPLTPPPTPTLKPEFRDVTS